MSFAGNANYRQTAFSVILWQVSAQTAVQRESRE